MSLLPGVHARRVQSSRLATRVLHTAPGGAPVIFVHGNVSSGRFFEDFLATLPPSVTGYALDLRGYGEAEPLPIDATRGVRDFADDVASVKEALGIDGPAHFVGWSVGGGVVLQLAIDRPEEVASLVLLAPMSPFGFAGTRDAAGTPNFADHAGSGGGTANPDFVKLLAAKDRSADQQVSPRNVMNGFYVKPPFRLPPEREEVMVDELLLTRTGTDHYPGDITTSPNWPTVAPGTRGTNNAISSKYTNLSSFADVEPKPPVTWIHGADDQIVSDTSLFDVGFLGQIGAIPGWPGADVYPAQPMIGQLRALFDRYRANGGDVRELLIPDCGHGPHLERPDLVRDALLARVLA